MANPVTLLALRTEVREDTDSDNDDHITDGFLDRVINRGVRRYWADLNQADPDRAFKSATIATTAGTEEYAVPADFYKVRGVDTEIGGEQVTLRSFPFEERNRRRRFGGTVSAADYPRYRVIRSENDGSATRLSFDIDPGTRNYTLHYLHVPTLLALDTDDIDDVLGLSEYILAFAKVKVRERRDEVSAAERADLAQAKNDIQTEANSRHEDGFERPPRVRLRRRSILTNW